MYINFKLKIQAARDEKLNQDDTYKSEAENFKNQLAENYINEQANINGLISEAFKRSQKDILLAHVFVEVKPGSDTVEAYKKIKQAYDALRGGKDFGEVASSYSTDDGVKQTKGIIGYITVFTLPYEIENQVYILRPGAYSNIYRSNIGYHIFKNVSDGTETRLQKHPGYGQSIAAIISLSAENFKGMSMPVLLPDPFKAAGGSPFHEVNRAYRFVLNGILVPCLYLFR